jgi:DNA repair exonuclease SbcCD ATPase subunit
MIIKNITISNFKSIYNKFTINFEELNGLIKLSGPIGSGKTTIAEAILYGLFGTIKGQNNKELIAWNTKDLCVEINIRSKERDIYIKRCVYEPLYVEVNGKTLAASNKRNTQAILEEELYDVPKLAIIKMCVISFNAFNSLASMNPAETKQFSDEIFGFKLFTEYNEEVINEKRNNQSESTKLNAIYQETQSQVERLKQKKIEQQNQIKTSIDTDWISKERKRLVDEGTSISNEQSKVKKECEDKKQEIFKQADEIKQKMTEVATLGKQEKNNYNTFKSGICPTCGQKIDESHIEKHRLAMLDYADQYKKLEEERNEKIKEADKVIEDYTPKIKEYDTKINEIKNAIHKLDSDVKVYENNLKVINSNYDELIEEQENKLKDLKMKIDNIDIELGEWNDMSELFTKTLRYNLLESLIPHINNSIQFFINKLDQSYKVEYDQEFKAHIYVDSFDKEISYNNLSTGQKKTLDLAIIFGILQNIIASVDFNVFVLDELFSNMDADMRNTMLGLLNETLVNGNKTIFVINHAEMNDDYFKHKIRVGLENKKIENKKKNTIFIVKSSKYEQIF